MSRAELNMALLDIDRDDAALAAFDADPAAFLAGRGLSHDERDALEQWDIGALYALGAHPFVLFQAARSRSVRAGEALGDFLSAYHQSIAPHGYPDFTT
jgi:hypothetical protein